MMQHAIAASVTTLRPPARPTSQPVDGIDSTAPTATPRSAMPSSPAFRSSFCCTDGMSGTHVAIAAPLTKNMISTAPRADGLRDSCC